MLNPRACDTMTGAFAGLSIRHRERKQQADLSSLSALHPSRRDRTGRNTDTGRTASLNTAITLEDLRPLPVANPWNFAAPTSRVPGASVALQLNLTRSTSSPRKLFQNIRNAISNLRRERFKIFSQISPNGIPEGFHHIGHTDLLHHILYFAALVRCNSRH